MDPFLGQIIMVSFQVVPRGWAACNGQLLPIAFNQALFNLIGTNYGGDGKNTFALPDLRGRLPLNQNPKNQESQLGGFGGSAKITLSAQNLPPHQHKIPVNTKVGTINNPAENMLASPIAPLSRSENAPILAYTNNTANLIEMNDLSIEKTGQQQSFDIMPPYLAVNFIIATKGVYPAFK